VRAVLEDRGPLRWLVRPDPLEHPPPVVQGRGQEVDLASCQSTNSPSIQIFDTSGTGIPTDSFVDWPGQPATRSRCGRRSARWSIPCPRRHGTQFGQNAGRRGLERMSRPRPPPGRRGTCEPTGPRDGVRPPLPAMSGAEPCTGSNMLGAAPEGLRLPLAARPRPPCTAAPRSVMMSPNRLSVTTTSNRSGTGRGTGTSRRRGRSPPATSGWSAATSSTVRCHRSPAWVRTLVLWHRVRWRRPRSAAAARRRRRSARPARRRAGCSATPGWRPRAGCPVQGAAGAGVHALGVLPHDDHVAAVRGEARDRRRHAGQQLHRAQVDVLVEGEPHLQQQARSRTPGGTSGVPTAPSRIASCSASSASTLSGSTSPVSR
jgi:hypothetical protein